MTSVFAPRTNATDTTQPVASTISGLFSRYSDEATFFLPVGGQSRASGFGSVPAPNQGTTFRSRRFTGLSSEIATWDDPHGVGTLSTPGDKIIEQFEAQVAAPKRLSYLLKAQGATGFNPVVGSAGDWSVYKPFRSAWVTEDLLTGIAANRYNTNPVYLLPLLWLHGEKDSQYDARVAHQYKNALTEFIFLYWRTLGVELPVIVAEMDPDTDALRQVVRNQQISIANELDKVYLLPYEGIEKFDTSHNTDAGNTEIGVRYWDIVRKNNLVTLLYPGVS